MKKNNLVGKVYRGSTKYIDKETKLKRDYVVVKDNGKNVEVSKLKSIKGGQKMANQKKNAKCVSKKNIPTKKGPVKKISPKLGKRSIKTKTVAASLITLTVLGASTLTVGHFSKGFKDWTAFGAKAPGIEQQQPGGDINTPGEPIADKDFIEDLMLKQPNLDLSELGNYARMHEKTIPLKFNLTSSENIGITKTFKTNLIGVVSPEIEKIYSDSYIIEDLYILAGMEDLDNFNKVKSTIFINDVKYNTTNPDIHALPAFKDSNGMYYIIMPESSNITIMCSTEPIGIKMGFPEEFTYLDATELKINLNVELPNTITGATDTLPNTSTAEDALKKDEATVTIPEVNETENLIKNIKFYVNGDQRDSDNFYTVFYDLTFNWKKVTAKDGTSHFACAIKGNDFIKAIGLDDAVNCGFIFNRFKGKYNGIYYDTEITNNCTSDAIIIFKTTQKVTSAGMLDPKELNSVTIQYDLPSTDAK